MSVPLLAMTPFAEDMNLGLAYNAAMSLLPEDGWGCLLDHDIAFTTKRWYHQLQEAIAFQPEAGAFTACTNRIAAPWQRIGDWDVNRMDDRSAHNMGDHYRLGAERLGVRTLLDVTDTKGMGGVLICLSKRVWREVGGFVDGLLCVDHGMHFALQRAGRRVYVIEGLYVYHRRRAFDGDLPEDAPRAKHCPCRGPETTPKTRLVLP